MKVKNNLGITSTFLAQLPPMVNFIVITDYGEGSHDYYREFNLLSGTGRNKRWHDHWGNTRDNKETAGYIKLLCDEAGKEGVQLYAQYGQDGKVMWDRHDIDGNRMRCNTMQKSVKKNTGNRMKKQYQDMIGITPKQFVKNMKKMF